MRVTNSFLSTEVPEDSVATDNKIDGFTKVSFE